MATIHRASTGPLTERIDIVVAKDDYMPAFEASLKQYATKANIPGFRKGMVPAGLIRKMYGASVFADEVVRTVEKELTAHLRDGQTEILGQPLPSPDNNMDALDHRAPAEYRFSFEIGLKPSFRIADLASAPVVRYRIDVTDAMVDEEVARLRRKNGRMTEPETVDNEDNILNLSFTACDADGNPEEGAEAHDNSLLLKYFKADVRPRLMGLRKDESLTVRIGEAFDEKEAGWVMSDLKLDKEDPASLEKSYRITLTKIGLLEPAPMEEELFKQVYPDKELKTEQEFREQIRADIGSQFDAETESHLHHELYHVLLEKTEMDLPEAFLRRWLQEGQEKPKTDEEVEAEFPNFLRQLRWTLVSDRIVTDNALSVSREEVMDQLRRQVMGYFGNMPMMQENFEWIDGYVDRMMKDRQQFEGGYRKVLTEKVFLWAAGQSNPTEKVISLEDFRQQQEAHSHEH
jgi:trigger factor